MIQEERACAEAIWPRCRLKWPAGEFPATDANLDTARKVLDELKEQMIEDIPEDWEMHKEELWEYAAALERKMDENEEEGEEDEDEEDGDNDEEERNEEGEAVSDGENVGLGDSKREQSDHIPDARPHGKTSMTISNTQQKTAHDTHEKAADSALTVSVGDDCATHDTDSISGSHENLIDGTHKHTPNDTFLSLSKKASLSHTTSLSPLKENLSKSNKENSPFEKPYEKAAPTSSSKTPASPSKAEVRSARPASPIKPRASVHKSAGEAVPNSSSTKAANGHCEDAANGTHEHAAGGIHEEATPISFQSSVLTEGKSEFRTFRMRKRNEQSSQSEEQEELIRKRPSWVNRIFRKGNNNP